MRALALVLALAACGKKSSPPKTHDDAGVATTTHTPAPSLPPTDEPPAPPDASIATHVTPPPSTAFGHFCVKTESGRSKCVTTEEECKKLAPRCGQWKSVFCFMTPTGPKCFTSAEDCKAARSETAKAGEQVTGECLQDEM